MFAGDAESLKADGCLYGRAEPRNAEEEESRTYEAVAHIPRLDDFEGKQERLQCRCLAAGIDGDEGRAKERTS